MNRIEFHAMGSHMAALVDSDSPAAQHLLERVPGWFEEWEQSLSRFRPESELSRLNRLAGQPVQVSQILWDVFAAAHRAETWTRGLVRPTMLDALLQAGYDRSFELLPANVTRISASQPDIPDISTSIGWDETTHTLFLPESVHLDLGGVAKGWAAQQAIQRLAEAGPALMDAGGDIAISAPCADDSAWPVGIRDPFQPERDYETLKLAEGGTATSGTDYHRWMQDGQLRHHIIDPRSGLPAETDILTCTIIAPDAVQAEAAAKAVLIAGSGSGLDWLEADPLLAGVLVRRNGEVIYSQRMKSFLW
jgi:FAD:protein FMN transferase